MPTKIYYEKRDKIVEHKYILLNERVRDMVISKNKKTIIMFLETSSSIIILKKQNNWKRLKLDF